MKYNSTLHLTATERKIINFLLDSGESKAGTKNISIELEKIDNNKYVARLYKYCAPALLGIGIDLRPEMQVPKWNFTGKTIITIK